MSCLFVGVLLLVTVMAGFHEINAVARSTVAPSVVSVMDAAIVFAPEEARFRIEEQYLKLRAEWERAREEQEQEEGEEEEAEEGGTFAAVIPGHGTVATSSHLEHLRGRLAFDA
jgi:hypothetical protein